MTGALWVVFKREYLETVRKRSFIIWTLVLPLFFAAVMFVPSLIISRGMGDKTVAVLDLSHEVADTLAKRLADQLADHDAGDRFGGRDDRDGGAIHVEVVAADDLAAARDRALERLSRQEIDGVLVIPADVVAGGTAASFYSRSAADLVTKGRLSAALSEAVIERRFAVRGVTGEEARRLLSDVKVDSLQATRSGPTRSGVGGPAFLLVFLFVMLLIQPLMIHGQEILRGVAHEKSERIVESLLSSISAFDLLTGKVLAIAAVGLTQIAVWVAMGAALLLTFGAPMLAMNVNIFAIFTPAKLAFFVLFYVLGFLIYSTVFASAGAAVSSEKEAQQMVQPIVMLLMVPLFLSMVMIFEPDSRLATVLSLIPIFAPVAMFLRVIVSEPPAWQVVLAIGLCVVTIFYMFRMAARIFRVGILWYGKRPSLPEFLRWMRNP